MDFKYKIADVAKEFGVPAKKVIETVAPITGETYKTGGTFGERELDFLLEKLTRENAETSLDAYLASGVKAEEKKPEPKKAEPRKQEAKKEPRRDSRKPEKPAEKRSEKRVTLQELAANTGIKKPVAATEQVQVNRAQVSVDTRTVDVNVDKFNARYDDLADSRNMPGKRKKAPTGKKEKFNNRNNRRGQQFGRRRETEAERLQRIQLEKARNAQLKISIPDEITVGELASRLKQTAAKVVAKFMQMGEMHAVSDVVDFDTAALIAEEFHAKVEHEVHVSIEERLFVQEEDNEADLVARPPVVVVMGHVDHGKTSILDAIRKTNVTAGEAGGITQAIGAYQVATGSGDVITFLDTPGHEAFTAMRARGAQVTDVIVLVVAADDGVMPQTIEAINHAKAAEVPIVVAVNKIDKAGANPDRVRQELTEYGVIPEEWGGSNMFVEVSAKQRLHIDDVLETILLQADVLELKANPDAEASGFVIEANLDKGRGPVATVLVQRGTLHPGDAVVAGTSYGRVRALVDPRGRHVDAAGPADPVEILGLSSVPTAGDEFRVFTDERDARKLAEERALRARLAEQETKSHMSLDDLFNRIEEGKQTDLNLIVKADVQGSIEALRDAFEKMDQSEVRINIVHSAVGGITETDVTLASASDAIIIGFNVRPTGKSKQQAEKEKVDIRLYRVIYQAIEEINAARVGLLSPDIVEEDTGTAEVRETFKVPKVGTIAGCYVTEGEIHRDDKVRIVRDGTVIFEGAMASLRRFKDDVKTVKQGYECGIGIHGYQDLKIGDTIEGYQVKEVERTE